MLGGGGGGGGEDWDGGEGGWLGAGVGIDLSAIKQEEAEVEAGVMTERYDQDLATGLVASIFGWRQASENASAFLHRPTPSLTFVT